jgi:hypothetical protein
MKTREFWPEIVTQKSWEKLVSLSQEYNFIVIGGWAAFLWTGLHKSKDIDLVIDYDTLNAFRKKFQLEKNERLKKYEIKMGEFDIDLYLPGYSKLSFPVEHLREYVANVKALKVPYPEVLVIMKQGAEIERRGSIKGRKDLIDILTILIHSGFSIKKYKEIVSKFSLKGFVEALDEEVRLFNPEDIEYLGLDFNEFAKWKKNFLRELKSA